MTGEATRVYQEHCPGCGKDIDKCYYAGDCLEMRAIYQAEQREKLKDINISEVCDDRR